MTSTSGNGEIIALIPAYNEARFIGDVVKGAARHVPVVVIDDGSSDGTGGAAALAGAKVVAQARNQGKGKALLTGFDYAIGRGVDAAITLDADGQHDPDEIPLFIEAFRAGKGDIIIGKRQYSQMPAKSQFGNRVGSFFLRLAMGRPVPDNQSGYRLFSRRAMQAGAAHQHSLRGRGGDAAAGGFRRADGRLGADQDDLQRKEEPLPARAGQRPLLQDDLAHLARPQARELRLMEKLLGVLML